MSNELRSAEGGFTQLLGLDLNLKVLTVNSNLTRTDVRIKRSFTYDVLGYVTEAGRTVGDTAQFGQRKVMANTMLTSGNDAWLRSVTYPWADLPGSQIRSRSWVDQEFDKSGRLAGIIGETGPEQFNVEFNWHGSTYLGRSQAWSNSADPLESSRQFDALGRPLRWTARTVDLDSQGNPTWTSWADSYCGGT